MSGKWSPIRFKSTWRDYRYGSKSTAVTLAPIFKGKDRENAIDSILTRMRDWRQSPFEQEGPARAGVRSALCLAGHSWARADAEAASLVSEALKRIGARRPSWDEGQWQYSHPRENCYRCNSPIDMEDQARGFRYCSDVCARATRQHFSDELPWDHELRRMGYWQIVISKAPVLTCKHCEKKFKTMQTGGAIYCSPECQRLGQRTLVDKPCKWCGEMFRPKDNTKVYCSMGCRDACRVDTWKKELPEKTCPVCHSIFRPGMPRAVYCSDRCWKDVKNARRRKPSEESGMFFCEAAE